MCVQEPSKKAIVWRFLNMPKFRDFMANEELYLRRADRFANDPNEGVPPDDWLRVTQRLRKLVLEDEIKLSQHKGTLAQFRESSYISCWHLFKSEDPEMWKAFAPYGVAICSRYELLKSTLNPLLDQIHMGLTQYGYKITDRYNLTQFIFTKGTAFLREQEVRIVMSCYDPVAGTNRHIGPTNFPFDRPLKSNRLHKWVADGKRRRIAVKPLVTGVVVSPWASNKVHREVKEWVTLKGLNCEVMRSILKTKCLPTLKELAEAKRLMDAGAYSPTGK